MKYLIYFDSNCNYFYDRQVDEDGSSQSQSLGLFFQHKPFN